MFTLSPPSFISLFIPHILYINFLSFPPHVTLVKSSQISFICESAFPYCFRASFTESCGLINIKLCRNQQNCHFYDIADQPEDISSQFCVQLYLSGTIGAFHASAVDDKKIHFSLRLDVLFVVKKKSISRLLFQSGSV